MDAKGLKGFQIKFNEAEMHEDWNAQYQNYSTASSATDVLKNSMTEITLQNVYGLSDESNAFYLYRKNKLIEQLPENTPVARKRSFRKE